MANPIYLPEVYLGGLSFDESENWEIILIIDGETDSIIICSSTERSIFNVPSYINQHTEFVLTKDSLKQILNINSKGDSIAIITYLPDERHRPDSLFETIVFGNYPGAIIPSPEKGQSITRIHERDFLSNIHCLKDSLNNCFGTMHGKIFNKNNDLITNGIFGINPISIYKSCLDGGYGIDGTNINSDGTYSVDLYSMIYSLSSLEICSKGFSSHDCTSYNVKGTVTINTLNFTILPNTNKEMDIHLLDDYVGVEKIKINSPDILKVFPNPIVDHQFNYEISAPVRSTNCSLQLYNAKGQTIWHQNTTDNRGSITLPSNVPNGAYFLQLWLNGKAYQSKQLVVDRK